MTHEYPPSTARTLFFDLETSGLNAIHHDILQIGLYDPNADRVWTYNVKIARPGNADPQALSISGWAGDPEDALDAEEVIPKVLACLRQASHIGGHNVVFDLIFLNATAMRYGILTPSTYWQPRRLIDTATVGAILQDAGLIGSRSLSAIANYYGLTQPVPHNAGTDAKLSSDVYRRFLGDFRKDASAESEDGF